MSLSDAAFLPASNQIEVKEMIHLTAGGPVIDGEIVDEEVRSVKKEQELKEECDCERPILFS